MNTDTPENNAPDLPLTSGTTRLVPDVKGPAADELQAINLELARLFHREPAATVFGAEYALSDTLVVCGILGGKDVGKSTLINTLACTRVSADEREVGPGTTRPTAYVHAEMTDMLQQRFRWTGRSSGVDISVHHADAIRNVVLVDLPDFDSQFREHLDTVRAVAPLLDRLIWVLTPRKIGDREWVALFREVIKDARNVQCVLNKLDEIVIDDLPQAIGGLPLTPAPGVKGGGNGNGNAAAEEALARADRLWESTRNWVSEMTTLAGCPQPAERQFLVAAEFAEPSRFVERVAGAWDDAHWTAYTRDEPVVRLLGERVRDDVERLRQCVLSPVSPVEAGAIKQANRQRESAENTARIGKHFDLPRWLELLERACEPEYYRRALTAAFEGDYEADVCSRLARTRKSDTVLAETLLSHRVEQWPILRVVYWPLSGLVAALGRRLAKPAPAAAPLPVDPWHVHGRGLTDRVGLVVAQARDDHDRVVQRFGLEPQLPTADQLAGQITLTCETLVEDADRETLRKLQESSRPPGRVQRFLLWAVLLWFPLIQPLADGLLTLISADGAVMSLRGLLQLIGALGAGHLLKGLAFVLAVYVAWLAAMYARAVQDVRRARRGGAAAGAADTAPRRAAVGLVDDLTPLTDELGRVLADGIATPLITPFARVRQQLAELAARLERVGRRP